MVFAVTLKFRAAISLAKTLQQMFGYHKCANYLHLGLGSARLIYVLVLQSLPYKKDDPCCAEF